MKQAVTLVVLLCGTLLGTQGWADAGRRPSAHRLLNKCMSHEMLRSRLLSYNEASVLCKARLASTRATAAPPLASAFPPRPVRGGGGT